MGRGSIGPGLEGAVVEQPMDEPSTSCLYSIDCSPTPIDAFDASSHRVLYYPLYLHEESIVLGLEPPEEDTDTTSSRCFNCGSTEHILSTCPSPINHQLVSLSRQLYDFFKSPPGGERFTRLHDFESSRQMKLHWIETFVPGCVRGELLREAIGYDDAPWLRNMALWGYPPGWVQEQDPRITLRKRVWDAGAPQETEDTELSIIADDEVEIVIIGRSAFVESSIDDEAEEAAIPAGARMRRRWAEFPPSHFQYTLLPVYNGFTLPPVVDLGANSYPAPPTVAPPPLPPPPPSTTPPPLPPPFPPASPYHPSRNALVSSHGKEPIDDEEQDMDVSDSD